MRLRNAYVIHCDEVIKGGDGEAIELHCSYNPDTLENNPEGQKVRGVIHWVSAEHGIPAEVRLYDRLFREPNPGDYDDPMEVLNPDSLEVVDARLEPALGEAKAGERYQFERTGYFTPDSHDDSPERRVFNRIVTLRDSWLKIERAALQLQSDRPTVKTS